MALKAYISNVSPLWPVERQVTMLREAHAAFPRGMTVFTDDLIPKERRAHQPKALVQRIAMLRPTTRSKGEVIYLASLAVLDWSAEGMMEALTLAMARNATVRVLDAGLDIGPGAGASVLHKAAKAFAEARKKTQEIERGKAGGDASAKKRSTAAKAKAETIRDEWKLASEDHPTATLLAKAGISLNTAKAHLGHRPVVQKAYQASLKRKAKRQKEGDCD